MLRGLGGITVGLPFLELFMPASAHAAPAPQRYVVAFGGTSLGMSNREFVSPDSFGSLVGNVSRGLEPLAAEGVEDAASWVSNLTIPWGSTPPPGGRSIKFHVSSTSPLLSGVRSTNNTTQLRGPTSDWVVANELAGPTATTRPVLSYRVQPAFYRNSNSTDGPRGIMSARDNAGNLEKVTPTLSPQIAFLDLFTGFAPVDPAEAAEAQSLLKRRKSVIDLVRRETEALLPKLGVADNLRMQRHFDELRALENKLAKTAPVGNGTCEMFADPGADPPIGGVVDLGDSAGYASDGAYSDEDLRASIMVDLIHMAFACDLSRVSSLMLTYIQCFMNMNPLYGHASDMHEIGHFAVGGGDTGANAVADCVGWHVKHIARLMKKLRDTTDFDGNTILDNTALVLLFEGGMGYDPELDQQGTTHSTENMGVLVGGNAGGINAAGGGHVDGGGAHPGQVINTVMGALGVAGTLGEVTGTVGGIVG